MDLEGKDQEKLRKYLLGELSEADEQALDEQFSTDDELFELLQSEEEELIDDYLNGDLSRDELERFDNYFMVTPERIGKLRFGERLRAYEPRDKRRNLDSEEPMPEQDFVAEPAQKDAPSSEEPPDSMTSRVQHVPASVIVHPHVNARRTSSSYFALAAAIIVFIVGGVVLWLFSQYYLHRSSVDKGMVALSGAFSESPIESRISELNYPPSAHLRGSTEIKSDRVALNTAELLIQEAVQSTPDAKAYHALGRLYLVKGDSSEAIAQLEKALQSDADNATLHSDLGAALFERAQTVNQSDTRTLDLGRSLQEVDRALELKPSLKEALFNRALCLDAMMAYGEAVAAWRKYLDSDPSSPWADEAKKRLKASEEHNKRTAGKDILFEKFLAAAESNDTNSAWDAYSKVRYRSGNYFLEKAVRSILEGSKEAENKAYNPVATLMFCAKLDLAKTQDHYVVDLASFYSGASTLQQARAKFARELLKAAADKYDANAFDDARTLFGRAAEAFHQIGDVPEALFARTWEAFAIVRVPDPKASLALLDRVAPTLESRHYRWLYAQSLYARADIESSLGNRTQAISCSNASLTLSRELDDPLGAARCLSQFTTFYAQTGDYQKSLVVGFDALSSMNGTPADERQLWPLYYVMAGVYLSINLTAPALAFGKEALSLSFGAHFPILEARSYQRLGLICQARADYAQAMVNAQQAIKIAQNLPDRAAINTTASATLNLAHLNRLTQNHSAAIELYDRAMMLYQQLDLHIYELEAHSGKFRSCISIGDDAAASKELPVTMKLYDEYRFKIAEESSRNRFFDVGQDIIDLAVDFEYSRMGKAESAYEYAEASRARSLFDLISGDHKVVVGYGGPDNLIASHNEPMTLEEIKRRMPEDLQLLQYSILNDKLICWRISRDTELQSSHYDVSADVLSQLVRSFADSIAGRVKSKDEEIISRSKALYSILVAPVEAFLDPRKSICIIPDKALNEVSFAALMSPQSNRYLIQDFTLQLSPSASVLVLCTQMAEARQKQTEERALVVGDPDFDQSNNPLRRLDSARTEAEQIADLYKSSPALIADRATEDAVLMQLPASDVAHFATHYIPDEKSPMLSRLLLARPLRNDRGDGYLRPADIYEMRLGRTKLVVLSGCQTGLEETLRGEGAIGGARAFLAAGVPLVVASLWPVESDSTRDLMIAFHRYRKEGRSTSEALAFAQRDDINQKQTGIGEFTWASFVLIGGYADF